ncbi:MAG: chorismate-binding protein [Myxococcota bacterium]
MDTPSFDLPADLDTPVSAFLKLAPLRPRTLLESVEGGARVGRYSFLGFGDAEEAVLDGDLVRGGRIVPGPLPSALRQLFRDGRWVGFTAYDFARRLERLPSLARPIGVPEGAWVRTSCTLVFDHLTRRAALVCDGPERLAVRREVERLLAGPVPATPRGRSSAPRPNLDRDAFLDRVATAKRHIAAGDVFQLVLSIAFDGHTDCPPFELYRALRRANPSPYAYYVEAGGRSVIGASPEALVTLDRGVARLRPIAGTRPRGATPAEDDAHEAELLADAKEAAEHVMLVDLARNDLGRVAVPGGVSVDPFRAVERYSHVMHLVSGVAAPVRPGVDAVDVLFAAFPAGTVTGAPKVRAMELIEALEPERRGVYGGTVGYVDGLDRLDQALAIRTLVVRDGAYRYQAGAGVVADSVPEREHAEILAKAEAIAHVLRGDAPAGVPRDPRPPAPRVRAPKAPTGARVLLVDNYDSFTYNLAAALESLGAGVDVRRNDVVDPDQAEALRPTHVVFSPGPGRPEDAGNLLALFERMAGLAPILGVCLGHQAFAAVFGGRVRLAPRVAHGKASPVYHDRRGLFAGLPNPLPAGRYHSLLVDDRELPPSLEVSAFTSDGEVMGLRHRTLPIDGVQFHPESVLTPDGLRLLENFLARPFVARRPADPASVGGVR